MLYRILRRYLQLTYFFFFRRWQIHGENKLPKNAAIIFVVNHQNAFLDAILIACSSLHEPWFLTRAGVFNSKIARYFFHVVHMMPVYRFRDGVKGLRNNDITIRACVDMLNNRKSILVFGEGDQSMRYQLRPLQKGLARIANIAQKENDWQLPLYIVPVGVQYDHYYNFRTRVLINYGEAIPVDASYKEMPEREFYDVIIDKTRTGLLPLMLHIENENYDAIVSYLHRNRNKKDLMEQLQHDKEVISNWNDTIKQEKRSTNYLSLIAGLPIHIYTLINNIFPYLLTRWILDNYVTPEFRGSLKIGLGMVIVPIFYLLQSIAVQFVFSDWRVTLAYALTLPFLSSWSVQWFKSARGTLL